MSNNPVELQDAIEQLNQRANLIVELLAIIAAHDLPAKRTLINRAKRTIDGSSDGEANYRAYCVADLDHKPEGTPEALGQCARMLEEYGPDCFPANDSGQVHFARAMMDATAAEIRAALSVSGDMREALEEIVRITHDRRDFTSRRVNSVAVAALSPKQKPLDASRDHE